MSNTQVKCGCSRSPSGFCDGSHALTNEQYQAKVQQQQSLTESTKSQLLTEAK